ncbi:RodZ domain-containing protein [Collimonas sp. H4R21]|uniref:RodZ domain-containing protein n=1 Tax=Collimonas rhizosphaerae TaxID=3126357 RepID=A0ABU9Q068_9BURK
MSEPEQLKIADADLAGEASAVPETAGANSGQLSLGEQLAGRRQELGWSVQDVASHLKLAPRQIDAMENDNYAALPTMVMTRGFIRSYAKLLGLDATALLATISPAVTAQPTASTVHGSPLSTPFSESRFSLMGRNKFAYKWLVVLAVLLLLLAVAIRLDVIPVVQNTLQSLAEKSAAAGSAASTEDKAVAPAVETQAVETQAVDTTANAALTATPAPAASAAAVSETGVNAAPANTQVVNPATAGGGELSLNFRQDSWVEIKRADNTVLISRLAKAGSAETVDMSQPVNIIIGNLAGVDATLRGVPVDLKAGSKTNVARLNLK